MNLEGMIPNCFSYDLICMFEISVKTKQRQTTKNQQTKPKQKSTLQHFIASKSSDVIKRSLCMHNYTITQQKLSLVDQVNPEGTESG